MSKRPISDRSGSGRERKRISGALTHTSGKGARSAGARPAGSDPDNPPMTEAELRSLKRVAFAKRVRWKLSMSQQDFAETFRIPLGTLRDWEQHRSEPDKAAVTLLQMIDADHKAVVKTLKKVPA